MVRHAPILVLIISGLTAVNALACEGCSNFESITTGQSVQMVQAGYSWSVIFLLGVPLFLAIWLIRLIGKACERAERRH